MRLFFAIELPDAIHHQLAGVQEVLRAKVPERVSWVSAGTLHLTLAFIGESTDAQANSLIEDLKSRPLPPPLGLTLAGLFPVLGRREKRPIAVSVWEPTGDLTWLRTICDDTARAAGVTAHIERQAPHVTLGYIQPIRRVTARELDGYLEGQWPEMKFLADSITLLQSECSPRGRTYTPLGKLKLPAAARPIHSHWTPATTLD